ncbi:MAG: hypothetical protein SGJ09_09740 [Phycisphaerae bacterium]|nr:hypothetical protein [Phycisphaerae bacterium]
MRPVCSVVRSVAFASTIAIASSATADLIVENGPVNPQGAISDAFSSGGTYANAVSIAQTFSLEDSVQLTGLSFWGSSTNFSGGDLANFSAFNVVIWNADFSQQVLNWTISLASFSTTATGNENLFNSPEYRFDTAVLGSLASGTYQMNVGAVLADGAGDAFVWSQGAEPTGVWVTTAPTFGSWLEAPPGIGEERGGAFRLDGTIPAPGAIALLGLAGLAGRRRRS